MVTPKVIILHAQTDPSDSVPASASGFDTGRFIVSTLDERAPQLRSLREQPGPKVEARSFSVALFRPFDDARASAGSAPAFCWGVEAVGALNSPYEGKGVTVAVLDTGIDRKHPAFSGIEVMEEDFTADGNGDRNGHGTHCAGIICGRDVSGCRIGVARGVSKLLVGKVLDDAGGGSTAAIIDGIQWALKNGAHVISMSLGMDFPGYQKALVASGKPEEVATSMALEDYRANVRLFDRVAEVVRAGTFTGRSAILVAATGNESRRDVNSNFTIAKGPPASADGFLSVAAVQKSKSRERPFKVAYFSNTMADIAAPGAEIWSARPATLGGGLHVLSGTSMAAPHVAGVAALWAEKSAHENDGDIIIGDVMDGLRFHARMSPGLTRIDVGKGIVQAPTK